MKNTFSKINCYVEDCQYCDNLHNICLLQHITINTLNNKNLGTKEGTYCNSYQKRRIITNR